MAGACAMIDQKSRAFGSDSSCFASNTVAVRVEDTSTTGDAPLTVTDSCSDATVSSTFTVAVKPTLMLMPARITVPNPESSYCTVYMPGGTPGSRYVPSSFVTVVRAPWSAGLVAVTVTPGMTPPLVSVTRPFSDPVVAPMDCAAATPAVSTSTDTSASARLSTLSLTIYVPPIVEINSGRCGA